MDDHGITGIDLVIVNLYPFEDVVLKGADEATAVENIDIGGPAMIRAAAKNHAYVTTLPDVTDYAALIEHLNENKGATTFAFRRNMALKAFARTASYDTAIQNWMAGGQMLSLTAVKKQDLRYGENPHQRAAVYQEGRTRTGVLTARQIQGKELSYNNINDTDAAFELVAEFTDTPAIAIIKHANPCGVAIGADLSAAWDKALKCDPVSAFGGIVAANQPITKDVAAKMATLFLEVIIAPAIDKEAKAIFATKENLRVLETGAMPNPADGGTWLKSVAGGYLVQDRDRAVIGQEHLTPVTTRTPTKAETADLLFAWKVCKHVKSNAIVYAKDGATAGIGAGQMSRIDSARIAAQKAAHIAEKAGEKDWLKGSVAASDAFFPFPDGLITLAEAGATAVIQPGGSKKDDEVIAAANERGIAMVFTGIRHFKH